VLAEANPEDYPTLRVSALNATLSRRYLQELDGKRKKVLAFSVACEDP
jgi:hypothetical protein